MLVSLAPDAVVLPPLGMSILNLAPDTTPNAPSRNATVGLVGTGAVGVLRCSCTTGFTRTTSRLLNWA